MRAAKDRNDGVPLKWTDEIKPEPIDDPRKRCRNRDCGAVTILQVKRSLLRKVVLTRCANCDGPLEP